MSDYERVTVRIDRDLYERMLTQADVEDRTLSSLLRYCIRVYLRQVDAQ